jgi:murein peptide amidase A
MRDYTQVLKRIAGLQGPGIQVDTLAHVEGYPIQRVRLRQHGEQETVLLMGGTHGDEPAGVETCLELLEHGLEAWRERFAFEVIACLNPHGYVHDQRHNAQDVDVNWAYERDDVPEVCIIRELVADRRFEAVMDFHEDWESPGYYLYELRRGAPTSGGDVVRAVRAVCPVNTSPEIEGLAAANGHIAPDPELEVARRGAGIPLVMFYRHTDHLLTSESPTALDMESRVAAHRVALNAVLGDHA